MKLKKNSGQRGKIMPKFKLTKSNLYKMRFTETGIRIEGRIGH